MNKVAPKVWDTEFFKFNVGYVLINNITKFELDSIVDDIKANKYKLVYFFVHPDDETSINTLSKTGIYLVDKKVVYTVNLKNDAGYISDGKIFPINQNHNVNLPNLQPIVLQSGKYSRFNTDKNIPYMFFEKMYTEWMANSLNKKIADEVFVYDNDIKGFVTIAVKNNIADIGLLAVDEKYRGNSIGTKLVKYVFNYCAGNNVKSINVATQMANKGACVFYEKLGFNISQVTNIYHYFDPIL
jgi:dTDP-4-amino-4,6-dideoxy-D-galactose acyltransferase